MTRMLVLVRSLDDARTAVAEGVDRIVVRPAPLSSLSLIGTVARGRCPVSLWWESTAGADVPAGLAACGADELWCSAEAAPPDVRSWATLAPGDLASVATAAERGCYGIAIHGGDGPQRLLETATVASLERQCRQARRRGLPFGIAGAMEQPDVPRLLALAPDILLLDDLLRPDGVPSGDIAPERVRLVRDLMGAAAHRGGDVPVVAPVPDRIFVRDWTVPLQLGAYGHEQAAQRVRFTVEADVVRSAERAADMRDVVTYDLITDAIARATVTHVALVETIAEDVAALILAHPRVEAVDITIEKLDLGPGSLGCRIRRQRAS